MPMPTFMHALALSAIATPLLMQGCATSPPGASSVTTMPMGTVTTYHRKSAGSLGNFDGQVVWTQRPGTWQGKPVVSVASPQAGANLHDPASMGLVAVLNTAGAPQMAFNPPIDYQWPLQVGKTWTATHQVTLYPSGTTVPMRFDYQVEAWGDVTVPAGTFKAFKLRWTSSSGETEVRWVSPAEGIATVKRHVERPASHPQGAGVLDAELLSRVLPAR